MNDDDYSANIQQAFSLHQQGQFEEALQLYEKLLSQHPDDSELHHLVAILLAQLNQLDEAINHLNQSIYFNKNDARYYNSLGNVLTRKQFFHDAINNYEKALELNPNSADAHNNLGNILLKMNKIEEALENYAAAVHIKPDFMDAHFNLGLLFYTRNQLDYAIKQFNNVLQLSPNHEKALKKIGDIYLRQENIKKAIEFYQRLLAVNAQDIETFNNLGVAFLTIKETKQAIACFTQALALDPFHATARNNLAEITKSLFENYADHYDQHMLEALHYEAPKLLRSTIDKIVPNTKLTILDLGCGTGLTGMEFRDLATRLVGVDVSPKMLSVAESKHIYDQLIEANINQLDNISEKFDLIVAADVFVYLGDLYSVFNCCHFLLKKECYFAFTVEALEDESINILLQKTGRFAHSKRYLEDLAKQFNFKICIIEKITLRKQDNSSILGYIIVCQA